MALCHITGTVQLPDGTNAAGRILVFKRNPETVVAQSGHGIVPDEIAVKVAADGTVDFKLYTGNYIGFLRNQRQGNERVFKFPVPESATALFQDILEAVDPVEPLPSWLTEAFDARDDAEGFADDAAAAADAAAANAALVKPQFDSVAQLQADTAMTDATVPVGETVSIAEIGSMSRVSSGGDFDTAAGLEFVSTKFAQAKGAAFITPEEVGVTLERIPTGDDTALMQKAFDAAIMNGYAVRFNRMYSVSPLYVPSSGRGLTLDGMSGARQKNGAANDVGLIARAGVGEEQSCLIKFGENGVAGDFENFITNGVTYNGNDSNITEGLIWADRLSQGGGLFNAFTRARGAAIMCNKIEDFILYAPVLTMLGGNDWKSAVTFSRPSGAGGAEFGTNVFRIIGGRAEWIDGPFFGIDPRHYATAWASNVFITDFKHEVGEITVDGQTYGSHRATYPIYYFPNGGGADIGANSGHRVSLHVNKPFFSVAYNARSLFWVGNVDDFVVDAPQLSVNTSSNMKLFELQDETESSCAPRNFIFRGGFVRNNGGDRWASGAVFDWVNKSMNPITFDVPTMTDMGGVPQISNVGIDGCLSMSRYGNRPEFSGSTGLSEFISDPDPITDPCRSVEKSVLNLKANTVAIRFNNSLNYGGKSVGVQLSSQGRSVRVSVRAKVPSFVSQNLYLRDDVTSSLASRSVTSTSWAWYNFTVPISQVSTGLRLNNSNTTEENNILIDCFKFDIVDYVEREFQINVPSVPAGGRVAVTTDNGGNPLTIQGSQVGDMVEWWPAPQFNGNLQGIIIEPQITSANTMTIYATNPTAAAIDLAGYVGWVFRSKSR